MTSRDVSDWKGLRAGVVGAGKSGLAAARLLARGGARVLLSESKSISLSLPKFIEIETGGHSPRLLNCDLLIVSPGVPHLPILRQAHQRKIPIWSELELASREISSERTIAITGTNGKTTTTTLVGELFKRTGHKTWVAGNIGTPLSQVAGKIAARDNVVLEVSSYQLEHIHHFHPRFSAILNITPDHLEHHGSMREYAAAKAKIFLNQRSADVCVMNADDPWCRKLASKCRCRVLWFSRRRPLLSGVWFSQGKIHVRWGKVRKSWELVWTLPGAHNVENALAAVGLAVAAGISPSTIQNVFKRFKGVEHRLEPVRVFHGVRYINDSKATNVDSTRVALEAFDVPLIVIMGGRGKGAPYTGLIPLMKAHVRHLLLVGEDAPTLEKELGAAISFEHVGDMAHAVQRSREMARSGDVVLLSPACASFDQYSNYEERGRHFKSLVSAL